MFHENFVLNKYKVQQLLELHNTIPVTDVQGSSMDPERTLKNLPSPPDLARVNFYLKLHSRCLLISQCEWFLEFTVSWTTTLKRAILIPKVIRELE